MWLVGHCHATGMSILVAVMTVKEVVAGEEHHEHEDTPQPPYIRVSPCTPPHRLEGSALCPRQTK